MESLEQLQPYYKYITPVAVSLVVILLSRLVSKNFLMTFIIDQIYVYGVSSHNHYLYCTLYTAFPSICKLFNSMEAAG